MHILRLTMVLESPLLMTGVANGEENSGTTLDYISGSAIRGACIAAYLRTPEGKASPDLPVVEESRTLFFSDQVRFLNGYLAHPHHLTQRALPIPLSWQSRKADSEADVRVVWDRALAEKEVELANGASLRAEKRPFFWQGTDLPILLTAPARHITIHNSSDDPRLKGATQSTVFRYEALAAGQRFIAYVISLDKVLLDRIAGCLTDGLLYLGGSQTAGYGVVRLTVSRPEPWTWQQGEAMVEREQEERQVLTLLSDAILRTPEGQPTTDLAEAIRVALNKPAAWKPEACFSRAHLTGGFNRKWGLPLQQSWSVVRGSTLVYGANSLSEAEVKQLLTEGIGERRNEGFGRVGLNLSPGDSFQTRLAASSSVQRVTLSEASKGLAQRMAERRLMNTVRAAIPAYLKKLAPPTKRPKNTQLSRLRQILRDAPSAPSEQPKAHPLQEVVSHLEGLRKPAKNQLALLMPTPSNQTWDMWLRQRATDLDALKVLGIEPERLGIAGERVEEQSLERVRLEATIQLMDAVLRWGTKQEGGEG